MSLDELYHNIYNVNINIVPMDIKVTNTNINAEDLFALYCRDQGLIAFKLPREKFIALESIKKYFPVDVTLDKLIQECLPGIPDFFVHDKKSYDFVEVKSETDSIRFSQLIWVKEHPSMSVLFAFIILNSESPEQTKKSVEEEP